MTSLVAQKRRRFLLQKTPALLVAAVLAVPRSQRRRPSSVQNSPGEKARTMLAQGDYPPQDSG